MLEVLIGQTRGLVVRLEMRRGVPLLGISDQIPEARDERCIGRRTPSAFRERVAWFPLRPRRPLTGVVRHGRQPSSSMKRMTPGSSGAS